MVAGAELLVEAADLFEHVAPDEHRVQLEQRDLLALELVLDVHELALGVEHLVAHVARAVLLFDPDRAAGEVDALAERLALARQRADRGAAGLVEAGDQVLEPAVLDPHVVVDQRDVFGLRHPDPEVARLGRGEVAVDAHELEAVLVGLLAQPAGELARRPAVDVDQAMRDVQRFEEAIERLLDRTQALALCDDDGDPWLFHGECSSARRRRVPPRTELIPRNTDGCLAGAPCHSSAAPRTLPPT